MNGLRALGRLLPAAVAVSAGGCGSTSSAPPSGGGAGAGVATHAVLTHMPHGEAVLSFDQASRSLTVSISVSGLAPDSVHPAHVHAGGCAAPGRVLYDRLSPVTANSTGLASDRTSTVSRIAEGRIPAAGWSLDLHNGPALGSPEQVEPIVCGDVSNPGDQTTVTVPLLNGPAGAGDQSVTGTVDMRIDGALKVALVVHGLRPHSAHVAQVHAGSCEAQSRVLYPLGTLTADERGEVDRTITVDSVTSMPSQPLYVVIRRSAGETTQADLDPIACANVGAQ